MEREGIVTHLVERLRRALLRGRLSAAPAGAIDAGPGKAKRM